MIKDYFFIAFRNLSRRKMRSWLTMIGIFIGILAVVSLIALGNGMRAAVMSQFNSLGTDKLIIQAASTGFGPPGSTAVTPLTEHDLNLIQKTPGVSKSTARLLRAAKFEFNNEVIYGFVASMPNDNEGIKLVEEASKAKAETGRLLTKDDRGKIVVGSNYAKKNDFGKNVKVGDKIKINDKDFEVVGVLKDMGNPQNNLAIIMPEESLRSLLNIGDEYDMIIAQSASETETSALAEKIKKEMRRDRGEQKGEEDFSVQTPTQALSALNNVLSIIQAVIIGIAAISLFVGGIGIMNSMYTSVLERNKEIGIMKAVGAKNSDIMWIFLFESGLLGLVGGIIGLVLGIIFSEIASLGAQIALGSNILTPQFSPLLLFGAVAFSVIVGVLSGLLPALSASKLPAVESLRGSRL